MSEEKQIRVDRNMCLGVAYGRGHHMILFINQWINEMKL